MVPQESHNFNFPHNTVILSGPEPQRGMLRRRVTNALKHFDTTTVVLEGRPGPETMSAENGKIISYNHLASGEMRMF